MTGAPLPGDDSHMNQRTTRSAKLIQPKALRTALDIVLGLTALVAPGGVAVPPAARHFDLPVMVAVTAASWAVLYTRGRLQRWEGALLLGFYGAYLGYLGLHAAEHEASPVLRWVLVALVAPLATLSLGGLVLQEAARRRAARRG